MVDAVSIDQAAGLRRMANPKPVRVLAVTGGKGGVGKTMLLLTWVLLYSKMATRYLFWMPILAWLISISCWDCILTQIYIMSSLVKGHLKK